MVGNGSRAMISETDERRYCEMYPTGRAGRLGGRFCLGQGPGVRLGDDVPHDRAIWRRFLGDCLKIGGQAAFGTGADELLAGWNFRP